MIFFDDLSEEEKKKIYADTLDIIGKKNLNKTGKFLQTKSSDVEKAKWLVTYKLFYEEVSEATLEELLFLKDELQDDYAFTDMAKEAELMERILSTGVVPNEAKELARKYDPIIHGLSNTIAILERLDSNYIVDRFNAEEIKKFNEGTLFNEESVFDIGIGKKFLDELTENQVRLIEVLIELFPLRDLLFQKIPNSIKIPEKAGRPDSYIVEKYVVLRVWEEKRVGILSQIQDNRGNIVKNRVVPLLNDLLRDLIKGIAPRTVIRWIW